MRRSNLMLADTEIASHPSTRREQMRLARDARNDGSIKSVLSVFICVQK